MLGRAYDLACRISPALKRRLIRSWYDYLSVLDKHARMLFMNYGYMDLDPGTPQIALAAKDEADRYGIQLYHHVASQLDVSGKDVLEVGCGRGGGASYIMRYLKPHSLVGVDISRRAIAFCDRFHRIPGLSFTLGDAEALPFAKRQFDIVLNVESSHGYGSMSRFLSEVERVLRPGGYLVLTDNRSAMAFKLLHQGLADSGLHLLSETCINANVVAALDRGNADARLGIERAVPKLLRKLFIEFAALPGSGLYEDFKRGTWTYSTFVLRKPPTDHPECPSLSGSSGGTFQHA